MCRYVWVLTDLGLARRFRFGGLVWGLDASQPMRAALCVASTVKEGKAHMRRTLGVLAASVMLIVLAAAPAGADSQGFIRDEFRYGYFYGTFDQSPNVMVFAGGTAQQFCIPPGEPGSAELRVFFRADESVDLRVNDKDQPIYLYYNENENPDVPLWLGDVCSGAIDPEPFATGTADLKVRVSVISPTLVDVFNSVNGKAASPDGTEYKVRGSADLIVENGVPVGNPEDFDDL